MPKARTGRARPAKVNPAPREIISKDAKAKDAKPKGVKAKAGAPRQKAAAGKAVTKKSAPKMSAAASKAAANKAPLLRKSSPPKKADAPLKTGASKRAAAPKATPPMKSAPRPVAKTVAVKTAPARRPAVRAAVPAPTARRARTLAPRNGPVTVSPKATPVRPGPKAAGNPPQVFTVSHLNQDDFRADGLRPYARYRNLGIAAATGGLCQAHVIRFTSPCTNEVRNRHADTAELQLIYVLQGWMKKEFDGHGEQMMSTGSFWLQSSGLKHTILDYSADCEVLEIVVPANFDTEGLT